MIQREAYSMPVSQTTVHASGVRLHTPTYQADSLQKCGTLSGMDTDLPTPFYYKKFVKHVGMAQLAVHKSLIVYNDHVCICTD